ncbi:MAG: methyltransferase [Steroidobacteraceae bacterium]
MLNARGRDDQSDSAGGADLYVLSRVIHDWNDERAVAILKVVRAAVAPHGRLAGNHATANCSADLSAALRLELVGQDRRL